LSNSVNCIGYLAKDQSELTARIIERFAKASKREALTGTTPAQNVWSFDFT
jgi:hypothetical protein